MTWTLTLVLALFTMNLVMLQEGPGGGGAPTDAEVSTARGACGLLAAAALAQWHASSLATRLPGPAFAAYAGAALAFAAYSGWPVLLTLLAGRGRVHGEVAVYYWFFLALMAAAVPLVIAGAVAEDDDD